MKTFDWIFTWFVPPFLFVCLVLGLLKAKGKRQPVCISSDGGFGPATSYLLPSPNGPAMRQVSRVVDKPKTKSFDVKLDNALDRAGKARKSILHSDLPEKDRLQIADEILYLIDEIVELQTIKLKEEQELWK